ncbi:MAG: thiaminase II [Rhodobacteraceae bacterium]|nr:thiaminase II [Paracoccaceae bacterium]
MTAPDYGRAFALWRDAAAGPWHAYTRHAFVEGLKDGTLPRKNFLHYLVQDYVFLVHFARAWALAVTKAQSLEEMRAAAATVNALVNEEMQLHVGTCAQAGLSEADLYAATERPENIAYTRYVMDAGHSGDLADLLAALMPCVLGYGEIGARLAVEATPGTPYADWIATYGGDDYQTLCRETGAMLDAALTARIGPDFAGAPRWPKLAAHFTRATELEVGFWDMGMTP